MIFKLDYEKRQDATVTLYPVNFYIWEGPASHVKAQPESLIIREKRRKLKAGSQVLTWDFHRKLRQNSCIELTLKGLWFKNKTECR